MQSPQTNPPTIYTASWRVALADPQVLPTRISVGLPKWIERKRAEYFPFIRELAPFGLMQIKSDEEFRSRYRERLDHYGVDGIRARIERVAADHPDQVLLLLCCFERDRADCHRGDFADWWFEKTGEQIPEWAPTEQQLSLDSKEDR